MAPELLACGDNMGGRKEVERGAGAPPAANASGAPMRTGDVEGHIALACRCSSGEGDSGDLRQARAGDRAAIGGFSGRFYFGRIHLRVKGAGCHRAQ